MQRHGVFQNPKYKPYKNYLEEKWTDIRHGVEWNMKKNVFHKHYGWIDVSQLKMWSAQLRKTHYWAHSFVQVYDRGKVAKETS